MLMRHALCICFNFAKITLQNQCMIINAKSIKIILQTKRMNQNQKKSPYQIQNLKKDYFESSEEERKLKTRINSHSNKEKNKNEEEMSENNINNNEVHSYKMLLSIKLITNHRSIY